MRRLLVASLALLVPVLVGGCVRVPLPRVTSVPRPPPIKLPPPTAFKPPPTNFKPLPGGFKPGELTLPDPVIVAPRLPKPLIPAVGKEGKGIRDGLGNIDVPNLGGNDDEERRNRLPRTGPPR